MSGLRMSLSLRPSAGELLGLVAAVPEIARAEVTRAAWEASLFMQREAQEETPTGVAAGGGLRGSIIAVKPIVSAQQIEAGAGTSSSYAVPVELGTKPHMPPVQPLQDWAHLKLGLPVDEAKSAGWNIARAISRRGTKPAHMFRRAFERNERQLNRIFERASTRIREKLGRRR